MKSADRFDAAQAAYREARRLFVNAPELPEHRARMEAALAEVNRRAAAILTAPARTSAAIRAKARAMAWEIEGEAEGGTLDAFRLDALRGLLREVAARR